MGPHRPFQEALLREAAERAAETLCRLAAKGRLVFPATSAHVVDVSVAVPHRIPREIARSHLTRIREMSRTALPHPQRQRPHRRCTWLAVLVLVLVVLVVVAIDIVVVLVPCVLEVVHTFVVVQFLRLTHRVHFVYETIFVDAAIRFVQVFGTGLFRFFLFPFLAMSRVVLMIELDSALPKTVGHSSTLETTTRRTVLRRPFSNSFVSRRSLNWLPPWIASQSLHNGRFSTLLCIVQ